MLAWQRALWVVYLLGFIVFAQLCSLTDETGIAAQTAYVINLEQALFLGHVPTVWLQERLFGGGIGLLVSLVLPTAPPWLASADEALPEVDRLVRLTLIDLSSDSDRAYDVVGPTRSRRCRRCIWR